MAQVSIYINDKLLDKIKEISENENKSISSYISSIVEDKINSSYPKSFVDLILKERTDEDEIILYIPRDKDFRNDTKREDL